MTLAAEVFTAVFPLLILAAVWLGSQRSDDIAKSIDMPSESRQVVQDAVSGSGASAFGVVGALWVLISATSLSRALTRAFCRHLGGAAARAKARVRPAAGSAP